MRLRWVVWLVWLSPIPALAGPAGDALSILEAQVAAQQAQILTLQQDLAALTARVTALEGGVGPPPTYMLTTATMGTGQGTVAAGGAMSRRAPPPRAGRPRTGTAYPAGAPVTLTATPATGSTFGGWNPAPCAPAFTMPAQDLTCTATFPAAGPPPVGGTDWQRLPTGADAVDTFTFTALGWDSQRNQAMAVSWEHHIWCLTGATNMWAKCGTKGPRNDFHNGGYAYDPVNDRHWVSSPSSTMVYWQRATGAYVEHSTGGCGMDPAMVYDPPRERFVCFGGWSTPVGTPRVSTFALKPVASSWTIHSPPSGPLFDASDAAKMTFTRAGWDAKRQRVWYVDEYLDLWALDPAPMTWTKQATTGTKPNAYAVFARHEAADRIVAWVSLTAIVDSGEPTINKTYGLDPATGVWAELATATAPPKNSVSNNMMVYDPTGPRVLLHTGYNFTRETWALTLGTQPPPSPGASLGGAAGGVATLAAGPPPTGACLPTEPKTFRPCAVPEQLDASPFTTGSKDLMWTWDSKRQKLYIGLGDNGNSYANGSGNHVVWSYDAATNAWAVPATFCGAPSTVSPNHPTDYGIMVYDPGRDVVWWLGQGDGFPPGQEGTTCYQGATGWPTGSIRRNGFLTLNPDTNTWTKRSEQATNSTGGAYYDAAGDRALNIEAPGQIKAWALATMPAVKTTVADFSNLQPSPPWTGATGGWGWAEYPDRTKWSFDPVERIAYIPIVVRHYDISGAVSESGVWMVTANTVTGAVALKARAPVPPGFNPYPFSVMSVWDTVNRKVIYPAMADACGRIQAMLVYHPTTDTWESTPVPANTHGATVAYDPVRNVVLLGGREFCEGQTPNPPRLYLWRYAP